MSGPWCAHQKVVRKDNNTGGLVTREWWECADGCGKTFTPVVPPPSPQPQEPAFRVVESVGAICDPCKMGAHTSCIRNPHSEICDCAHPVEPAAPLDTNLLEPPRYTPEETYALSDATPQEDTVAARSWHKVHGRPDVLGVRTLTNGKREYLMHNEALSQAYYVVIEEKI